MSILSEAVSDHKFEIRLQEIIKVCDECACDFDCYCASNRAWAERKLAEIKAKYTDGQSEDRK